LSVALLAFAAGARAATVDVAVEGQGLNDEMRDAVRGSLELSDYQKRDISAAELRSSYKDADLQIRKALEAFGFYDVQVEKSLTGDAASGWKARFIVTPGKPEIVRQAHVEVRGEGKEQRHGAAMSAQPGARASEARVRELLVCSRL